MTQLSSDSDDLDLCLTSDIPLRSRLFSLAPDGSGSTDQEGLLSLIVRTCHAHAVNPRRMIAVIFPTTEPLVAKIASAPFFRKAGWHCQRLGAVCRAVCLGHGTAHRPTESRCPDDASLAEAISTQRTRLAGAPEAMVPNVPESATAGRRPRSCSTGVVARSV